MKQRIQRIGAVAGLGLGLGLLLSGLQGTPNQLPPGIPSFGQPGGPREGLDPVSVGNFLRGFEVFDRNFHRSTGLGAPGMNANSCRACHEDPVIGGAGPLELNVSRFALDHEGAGPFEDLEGGQIVSKLFPPYIDIREEIPEEADVFEQRQVPTLLGVGLIETIDEAAILANADPTDSDGDGVLGVARYREVNGRMELGRFGWKAQLPTLADFSRDAMLQELGVTTFDDHRGFTPDVDQDSVPDPELSRIDLLDLTAFMQGLAPPQRTGSTAPAVLAGEVRFEQLGCAVCHVPSLMGAEGPVNLYSDLLLHDVMPADFRGMAEPGAGVGLYRTPPLWGISDTAPYMHDGRAESLDDAIRAHFSEGEGARVAYEGLTPEEQAELIAFLEDL